MEKVLQFQADGVATPESWASSNNISLAMTSIATLTICCRVLIPFYRNYHTVYSISLNQTAYFLSLALTFEGVHVVFNKEEKLFPLVATPGYWHSLCLQVNYQENLAILQLNKDLIEMPLNISRDPMPPKSSAYLVFGQLQSMSGKYSSETSFHGQISDFFMWTRKLSKNELSSYTECELVQNAVVQWPNEINKIFLNAGSAKVAQVDLETLCRPMGIYKAFLSPPLFVPVAHSICTLLGGNLTIIGNTSDLLSEYGPLEALLEEDMAHEFNNGRSSLYSSHSREKWKQASQLFTTCHSCKGREKSVQHLHRLKMKEKLQKRRTVRQITEPEATEDGMEELSFVSFCEFLTPPVFRVSGFCEDLLNLVEERYVVIGHSEGLPIFQGFNGKTITFANGKWIAQNIDSPYIDLWFEEPISNPMESPMGRHPWLILISVEGKDVKEDESLTLPCDSEMLNVNLSPCKKDEFTCSNGQCQPITVRCDRKADCDDNSDEEMCAKVYNPQIPLPSMDPDAPPPEAPVVVHPSPLLGQNSTEIQLKVAILKAEVDFDSATIVSEVQLTWKDPSLTFFNLQDDPIANVAEAEALESIWIPSLELGGRTMTKMDDTTQPEVLVLKESKGEMEDYQFSWEGRSYNGSENSLQLRGYAKISTNCIGWTLLYPFGQLKCYIFFKLIATTSEGLNLNSSGSHGGVTWVQKGIFPYDVRSLTLTQDGDSRIAQRLEIGLNPRVDLALISLFIPSLFIVLIANSSLYLSLNHIPLRIGTALFCLVAVTILQLRESSLQLGVRASDIWLFGIDCVIFLILLSHVLIINGTQSKNNTAFHSRVIPVSTANGKPLSPLWFRKTENSEMVATAMKVFFTTLTIILVIIYIVAIAVLVRVNRS